MASEWKADIISKKIPYFFYDYTLYEDTFKESLEKVLIEITNNSVQHSESFPFICAWLIDKNCLQIAIVDAGIGIQQSLIDAFWSLTQEKAILTALDFEKTWNPNGIRNTIYWWVEKTINAGIWLPLSLQLTLCNWWDFFLCSGNKLFSATWNNQLDDFLVELDDLDCFWRWTIAVINVKLDVEHSTNPFDAYKNTENFIKGLLSKIKN